MANPSGKGKVSGYLLAATATMVALFLVWYFSNVVAYIIISAVLAIIGRPLVATLLKIRIKNKGIPKWLAALVTLMMIWGVAVTFFTVFIPLVFGKVNEFSTLEIPHLIASFREPLMSLQEFIQRVFGITESDFSLADSLAHQLTPLLNFGVINRVLSSIVSIISNTVVALFSVSFITFFFLKEDHLFYNMVVAMFPKKYEENISHALDSITNLLMRYFVGIVIESTLMMLLISSVLLLWGVAASDAFFIGLVMGILNVIPYIGPLIGAGLAIFTGILHPLAWASSGEMLLVIGGTLLVCKALDDFVLQPVLYSNSAKAHPLEIFIVILVAGSLAGVLGMLFAIPAYNVIRVLAKEFFYNLRVVRKLTRNI